VLVNSRDLFGPLTFSICFATEAYAKKSPAAVQALREAIAKGITLLNSQPTEAAAILAADTGGRVSAEEFGKLLADPDMQFTSQPEGVSKLSIFMRSTGFLREPAGAMSSMMLKG
jgi:NitT/TauT family transport system substrate-binding protein